MVTRKFGLLAALASMSLGTALTPVMASTGAPTSGTLAYGGAIAETPSVTDRIKGAVKGGIISLATVFTNAGTAIVTNRMIQAGTAPNKIGWGIGTTAAAVGQTALVTESAPTSGGGRITGTESRTTVTVANDNYQVAGTVTAGSTLAITEAGLFDAVSAGNMLIRSDFAAINVVSGDSIAFTFGLKFVAG